MKLIREIILNLLGERYLVSEYTFGFEFEAIAPIVIGVPVENSYGFLMDRFFSKYFSGGEIVEDISIHPPKGYFGFEYKSPGLQATPVNFEKLIQMLDYSIQFGIKTNKSCGFHIHVGFPKLDELDTKWSLCQIALNEDIINMISKLGKYNFETALYSTLDNFVRLADRIKRRMWFEIPDLLSLKNQMLNAHPQGTIEWRGPRNFIKNKSLIVDFVRLLYNFIMKLSMVQSLPTLDGSITKKEFAEKLNVVPSMRTFNMPPEKIKEVVLKFPWLRKCSFMDAVFEIAKMRLFPHNYELLWKDGMWVSGVWHGSHTIFPRNAVAGEGIYWSEG
jgi:hypothetical protein